MSEIQSWQDILKDIILDPKERQRIAEELNVNPITLTRWASGKSIPRYELWFLLVRALAPDLRGSFVNSLTNNRIISPTHTRLLLVIDSLDSKIVDEILGQKDLNVGKLLRQRYTVYPSSSLDDDVEAANELYRDFFNVFKEKRKRRDELYQRHFQLVNQQNEPTVFSFRIDQEPLNVHNLTSILSSLSELATKYWLISEGRFSDLIEYTQTHNPRFEEEANIEITKITYNSPMNMDWKFDVSATNVAEALITTVDGITQVGKRLRKAELEILEKEQVLKETKQRADQAEKTSELEREKQQLEIEKQRLELQKQTLEIQVQQLEFQKKSFEYAIEMATKVIDTLRPGIDPDTRAMAVQAVLPNWIQLQNSKGLELVLPAVPPATKSEEDKS